MSEAWQSCQVCDERLAVHNHHRKLRSQGGGDEPSNLLRVCLECHAWIHANPSDAYARGLLVHSWADPELVQLFLGVTSDDVDDAAIALQVAERDASDTGERISLEDLAASLLGHVEEGEECPQCKRRVPHKKKASSPKSKVFSTRIPLDDVETFNEIVDAAAEHHGLKAKPHHVYWTLLFGVTLLLQQEPGDLPA